MPANSRVNPHRGEVWYVDLEPTRGSEMKKSRPCIVLSSPATGVLPLRVVVPLTGWQESFAGRSWLVRVAAGPTTGLSKDSTADALQIRSVDLSRFEADGFVGTILPALVAEIAAAVAMVVGHTA